MQAVDKMIQMVTDLVSGDVGRANLDQPGNYETMVFPGRREEISDHAELDFARWDTEQNARIGHEQMVKKWLEMPPGLSRDPQ